MRFLKNVLVASTLLLGTSGFAQQGDWAPAGGAPPESSDAVSLSQAESRRGPTWVPGNAEAKEFARVTGITIGEATSEMRRMAALSRFIERLQQRRPELFSFVAMRNGKLVIGLTDPSADLTDLLPRGLLDPVFVEAAVSAKETEALLENVTEDLRAAGFADVSVGISPETGRMTFLARDRVEALRAALESGSIAVDLPYDVESGGIEVSATLVGSASWNADPGRCSTLCGGTTGFSVMSTGSSQSRYVTTAGHVDNARARYNQRADST